MTNEKYNFSSKMTFHPWVGKRYFRDSEYDVRLLVLGEFHYRKNQNLDPAYIKNSIKDVISRWVKGDYTNLPYFIKCSRVLLNDRNASLDDKESCSKSWDHVVFYNYIQSLLPKPRKSPDKDQWEAAAEPFKEVLEKLKPDAVWIGGVRLSHRIYS